MPERILLCTTDDECPEHGRFIYFCRPCHERALARRNGQSGAPQ